jgi:hypothetical protein
MQKWKDHSDDRRIDTWGGILPSWNLDLVPFPLSCYSDTERKLDSMPANSMRLRVPLMRRWDISVCVSKGKIRDNAGPYQTYIHSTSIYDAINSRYIDINMLYTGKITR